MGLPPGGVDPSGVQGPDPVIAGSTPVPVGPSGAPAHEGVAGAITVVSGICRGEGSATGPVP